MRVAFRASPLYLQRLRHLFKTLAVRFPDHERVPEWDLRKLSGLPIGFDRNAGREDGVVFSRRWSILFH